LRYDFRVIYYLDPLVDDTEGFEERHRSFLEILNEPVKEGYRIHSWRTEEKDDGLIAVYVLYEKRYK